MVLPNRDSLRALLWPTRREVADLEHELARIATLTEQLLEGQQHLLERQADILTRVRRAQALTARAYEAVHDWPSLLAEARATPDYELAYEDPDPLVSIPIPTYHSPDTLCDRALASVLAQTHRNWEAIVVGDHCTDETEERVRALGDERIRWHNLEAREVDPDDPFERWGVRGSVPRATGIAMARGRWIAPLSHDDAWDSDHLEVLLATAREQNAELAYSRMRIAVAGSDQPSPGGSVGTWPPRLAGFAWQSAIFHAALQFLRYDRASVLASEPNDWNLARRAWAAGVRFRFVDRDTGDLYQDPDRLKELLAEYAERGLPASALAVP